MQLKNLCIFAPQLHADMVKLVDMPDLGSGAARRVGSSPIIRTKSFSFEKLFLFIDVSSHDLKFYPICFYRHFADNFHFHNYLGVASARNSLLKFKYTLSRRRAVHYIFTATTISFQISNFCWAVKDAAPIPNTK